MKIIQQWTTSPLDELGMVVVSGVVTYAVILIYTRIVGLRSFSKMSPADFAMTVAVGSLFGSTISSPSPTLFMGTVSLGTLFAGQWFLAWLRRRFGWACKLVDNEPLLLMAGNQMIEANLRKANVTRADVFGKLREANAVNYDEVLAVVFETTGDISVLHRSDADATIEPDFMQNVVGHEQLVYKP